MYVWFLCSQLQYLYFTNCSQTCVPIQTPWWSPACWTWSIIQHCAKASRAFVVDADLRRVTAAKVGDIPRICVVPDGMWAGLGIIQKLQLDMSRVMWERHKFQRVTSDSFDGSLMSWLNKQWPPVLSSSLGSPGVGAARRPWNLHQFPRFLPRCKCFWSVGPMQKGWKRKHCCRASRKSKRWTWKMKTFSPWQILLWAWLDTFRIYGRRRHQICCVSWSRLKRSGFLQKGQQIGGSGRSLQLQRWNGSKFGYWLGMQAGSKANHLTPMAWQKAPW